MRFPDASGVLVDVLPIRDGSIFTAIRQLVDGEVPLGEPDWLGMIAAIANAEGRPLEPDTRAAALSSLGSRDAPCGWDHVDRAVSRYPGGW